MNGTRTFSRGIIVAAGAAAAGIVWAIAALAGGIRVPSGDLPLWQVLLASIVLGAAGGGLLALLGPGPRGTRIWTTIAIIVVLASMSGPLLLPGIEASDRIWLLVIHLALALAYVPAMAATARPKRPVSRR